MQRCTNREGQLTVNISPLSALFLMFKGADCFDFQRYCFMNQSALIPCNTAIRSRLQRYTNSEGKLNVNISPLSALFLMFKGADCFDFLRYCFMNQSTLIPHNTAIRSRVQR